ncbi:MAG: hypothetical protein OXB89_04060 [Anaerolineaceae bacterium]|nr:hypothetical protein [Anaerolineaceae bacterium]
MWHNPTTSDRFPRCIAALFLMFLTGCNLVAELPQGVAVQDVPVPTPPLPEADANAVMAGICLEAARDAAGQLFVLRSADELTNFFDLADNSRLCRQPVTRRAFDFGDGRVLAGLWSAARGCAAAHHVRFFQRDSGARRIRLQLQLGVTGDCDYELVRPWWMTLEDARDYEIAIEVLP